MKHIQILILILLLTACAPTTAPASQATTPTITSDYDFSGVHLRLNNRSGQDFEEVVVIVGEQTAEIGTLPSSAVSKYVTFTAVSHPPTIHASSNDTIYEWAADPAADFMAGGKFTFELSLENGELAVLPLMENPILQDAQFYADEMGVSLEEALARLNTQSEDAISQLNNQLQANEADTFAGLWLQHEPEYRVVVAFTRNGAETIAKYVTEGSELAKLIELRPVQYSYAQLLADQQAVLQILERMQMPVGVAVLVQENVVELAVTDRAAFDAALAAANAELPASVIITTTYEPVGDNPPFAITPVPDVFMAQRKMRDLGNMEALLIGELVVEDGCLRVQSGDQSTLVIWQADYFLTNNEGLLQILDETGAVVAQVGEMVYMGGGEVRQVDNTYLQEPIPAMCSGSFWWMGEFLPEEYIPNVVSEVIPLAESVEPSTLRFPDFEDWALYEHPTRHFALRYPPDWTVTERDNGVTITASQTAVINSGTIPYSISVTAHEKFAEDASLYDIVFNEYHFEAIFEQFEETLTEETINGRIAYRSTIIPAIGGRISVFFEDNGSRPFEGTGRFVEVAAQPFGHTQPDENQEIFEELFAILLESVTLTE